MVEKLTPEDLEARIKDGTFIGNIVQSAYEDMVIQNALVKALQARVGHEIVINGEPMGVIRSAEHAGPGEVRLVAEKPLPVNALKAVLVVDTILKPNEGTTYGDEPL